MPYISINPATGQEIKRYASWSLAKTQEHLGLVQAQYLKWSELSVGERGHKLLKIGDLLLERKETLARVAAQEMGKPVDQSIAEIEKCVASLKYFVSVAEESLTPKTIKTEFIKSYVAYESMGIVLGIMPWNFPYWQILRFALPVLLCGNAVVVKPSSNIMGCSLELERIFVDAGVSQYLFSLLPIEIDLVDAVICDERICGISLTGSVRAGKSVAAQAGRALKKVVMELGGSDPYVILEDADLSLAAESRIKSRFTNSGQVCVAAKRFIVVQAVKEAFVAELLKQMPAYQMGDPLDSYAMGPMARTDLRDEVHQQVLQSQSLGAKVLTGGFIPDGPGAYYPPTLVDQVIPGMPLFDQEVFGPVAAIVTAKDEAHAIELANQSEFGLGACVFTKDLQKGEMIAMKKLKSGVATVNKMIRSDVRFPFGGIKNSGFGRELGLEAFREFVNIKTVIIS